MVDTGTEHYAMVRDMLSSDETVELEVVEHRLGGAKLFDPAHAFATNHQIIIVRRSPFGFRKDYKIIRYESITEVKLERGIMFARVHFSLQGEQEAEPNGGMKWLVGLKPSDALNLLHFVNKMEENPVQVHEEPNAPSGGEN